MFGRSEDIFEDERPKEEKVTRQERREEKLREKERKKQEKEDLKQQRAAFEEEMKGRELEEKRRKQLEKEDARNAKLAKKAEKKIAKVEMRSEKKPSFKNRIFFVVLLLLCFAAGFGAAVFVAWIGHVSFAPVKFLPFALLAFVFTFSTANFFLHEGKIEVAAGAFSLLSLAGGIVELAYLFH